LAVGSLACLSTFFRPPQLAFPRPGWESSEPNFYDIRLAIEEASYQSLRAKPRISTKAICFVNGGAGIHVKLHLKGSSTFNDLSGKPSFSLKRVAFDSAGGPQIFKRKFYLNNCEGDASLLRDFVARLCFRNQGIKAPALAFAHVELNGRPLGFYTVGEGVTKKYACRSFEVADGVLSEGDQRGILDALRADSRNRHFLQEMSLGDEKEIRRRLLRAIGPELLSAYIATEIFCANDDGLLCCDNNYWVFRPDESTNLYLFPHTSDWVFRRADFPLNQAVAAPFYKPLWEDPSFATNLTAKLKEMSTSRFQQQFLSRCDHAASNLFNEIYLRQPSVAMDQCFAYAELRRTIVAQGERVRALTAGPDY